MGNKRLKKRAYSLKGLGRRGLSMLMAMVMTLSLVQISAFAIDGEESDTLKPQAVTDKNKHGITLSKTAERVGDTEWQVTVKADIGETPIKQQPLEVVFVLDRSGSMNWCTDAEAHAAGSHNHRGEVNYNGKWYQRTKWEHYVDYYIYGYDNHPQEEFDENGSFDPSLCSDYTECTRNKSYHETGDNGYCYYWDEDGVKQTYPTRLAAAKSAMSTLKGNLPEGRIVKYVTFADSAKVAKDEAAFNKVTAKGGTNIMAGVDLGIGQFSKSQTSKKVLVLLSDGKATAGGYTSETLRDFGGDVYTVGFALDNPKLKEMVKGDGKYIYAKDADALDSAFTELSTRIAAMIVDPMGDEVNYVDGSAAVSEGSVAGSISVDTDGRTLRWTPMNTDSFSNTVIQYTYRVKLDPSKDAGDYTGIKLNNTTYLQYGVKKNAYTANFPIPAGYYKVSTLEEQFKVLDENGSASDITDSVQKPHDFQSKVTDNGDTTLDVYAPIQALDTSDAHVKYVYQYSELDGNKLTEVQEDGTYPIFEGDTLDVTNQADAHTLVHYYAKEYVNSVEYVYDNEFEDLHPNMDLPEKQWFKQGSEQTRMENPEDEKYNFSGWSTEDVTVDEDGKFTLNTDVTFHGSWEIKPSYQVQANYFTVVDGEQPEQDNKNGPILLDGPFYTNEEEDIYTVADKDMTFSGEPYTEVQLGQGSPAGVEVDGRNVTGIVPTTPTTTITVNIYRYKASDAYYTVTHKYIDVDPDNAETEVETITSDRIKDTHGQTVKAASITPDTKDGKYEVVDRSEDILLDKKQDKNITLTYKHYQYRVTTQGDAGVASLTETKVYDKGDNAQVSFTLKEGYQVKSVTDNGADVTASADVNGVYSYSIKNIQANHAVDIKTELIPYTLTVKYEFTDGSKHESEGFKDYTEPHVYNDAYTAKKLEAPAGYHFVEVTGDPAEGKIKKNTEVTFHYTKNGDGTVIVNYLKEGTVEQLLGSNSASGTIGTAYDLSSTACGEQYVVKSITKGNVVYDLVSEPTMTGIFQKTAEINLYYKERAKANITIKYQSEDVNKATFTKPDYTAQGYLNTEYNISGTTYLPETITETLADGSTRTWYYSGKDQLVITGAEKLTGTLTGDITVVAKYYLKPTYSVTATYTTVSNGVSSNQTDAVAKQTGEAGQNVPFDLNTYVVKYGFTSSNYQNDLAVNGKPASDMPAMEKFGDYAVTLSYKKSVNSGVSTTIQHEFKTFVDGVETLDTTTAPDDAVTETWGNTVDMSKFSKAGQAGYEGYTVEKYSAENGQLRAGDKGTITYVRNLVSVVFDLSGGTWNNSLNNVNYNVVKGGSLDKDGQQPIPAPTKDGFKFAGWSAQPDNAVPTGTFDQRTVFTAKWEQESVVTTSYFYTVTYNYTVTTDGTVTYQDSETTQVQDTTKASQTINASATASHGGYTFDLASPAEQTADLTGTTREAPHQFVVNYVLTVNNNGGGGGRDDRDDDDPKPNPGGDTEIKDDDVPKTDLPEQPVEIPDEDTPKTDLPQAPVDIPDEDTPKADVPKTGDAMGLWVMAAVASGAGLIWLNLTGKKRKDDNG